SGRRRRLWRRAPQLPERAGSRRPEHAEADQRSELQARVPRRDSSRCPVSNLRFPDTLAGLEINVQRDADFDVKVQTSQSRKELRWTPETYPLTRYKVGFEVLRSDSSPRNPP